MKYQFIISSILIGFCLSGCKDKKSTDTSRREALRLQRGELVSVPMSSYSTGASSGPISFDGIDQEDDSLVRSLLEAYQSSDKSADAAREMLSQIRALETHEIYRVGEILMEHPDETIRAEALTLASGATDPIALPLIKRGLTEDSEDLRRLAMEMALHVKGEEVVSMVEGALNDSDDGVRLLAVHVGMNQDPDQRWRVIEAGMQVNAADVVLAVLAEADATPAKHFVPRVIRSLSHASEEVRDLASDILGGLSYQRFSNEQEAARWWAKEAVLFNEDLIYTGQTGN